MVLIVSEFATNAIRHSHSRGQFLIVRAEVFRHYVWVGVHTSAARGIPGSGTGGLMAWTS